MGKDTRLKLKGKINDCAVWDDTIDLHVEKFYKKHNVYPNILLANEFTYPIPYYLNGLNHLSFIIKMITFGILWKDYQNLIFLQNSMFS